MRSTATSFLLILHKVVFCQFCLICFDDELCFTIDVSCLKDMVGQDLPILDTSIPLVKVLFEGSVATINHHHILCLIQNREKIVVLTWMIVGVDIVIVEACFELVEHGVTNILCVTTNIKKQFHFFIENPFSTSQGTSRITMLFLF